MATEKTLLDRIRMIENRIDYLERGQAVGILGTDQTIKGSHDRIDSLFGAGVASVTLDADNLEISAGVLRLSAAAAGNGLTGAAGAALAVNVGTGLEINSDAVRIAAAAAGDGLTGGAGSALAVAVDGVTIEISSDALRIKGLTRTFFIPATRGYVSNVSNPLHGADERGFLCDDAIDTYVLGNWYLPADYGSSLTIVAVVECGGTTGSMYAANAIHLGAVNEAYNTHTDSSGYAQVATATTQKLVQSVDVSSVAAGDYMTCVFHRDGNAANDTATAMAVYCKGWLASYTATR